MTIVWSSNIVRIDWNFGRWGRDVIPNSIKLIAGRTEGYSEGPITMARSMTGVD